MGNNSKLNFWLMNWVKGSSVRELIEGPLTQQEEGWTIAKLHHNDYWNLDKISFALPGNVVDKIHAIPIQSYGDKEDTLMWRFSLDGDFNMASAYKLAIAELPKPPPFSGCWLWGLDTLSKIKHFLWLCCHGSIPVKQVLKGRGINCTMECPLCHMQEESIIHALRDCLVARKFWLRIGVPQALGDFLNLDLLEWLRVNCLCSNHIHANGFPWCSQFPFAVWSLWKHRNRIVFNNSLPNPKLHHVCLQVAREHFYCVSKVQKSRRSVAVQVRWIRPPIDWFKLNSDGASLGNPGQVGGGGLNRNHQGKWIKGYMRHIGFASSVTAELWALKDGLQLAFQLSISHILA